MKLQGEPNENSHDRLVSSNKVWIGLALVAQPTRDGVPGDATFQLGLREEDRKHVHFFVGDGKNGYKKRQFYIRLEAVFPVLLLFFLVEPGAFSQTAIQHSGTEKNWSCLKRKDLLSDKKGRPVWLTSEELMDRVLEQKPIERPGPLGKNNLRGVVRIRVLVNHGKVICAQGVDGHPMAIGPAIHSLRKWTFKAFTVNGKRKSVVGVLDLPFDFR